MAKQAKEIGAEIEAIHAGEAQSVQVRGKDGEAKEAGWGPYNEGKIGENEQSLSTGDLMGGERQDTPQAAAHAEHMAKEEEKYNEGKETPEKEQAEEKEQNEMVDHAVEQEDKSAGYEGPSDHDADLEFEETKEAALEAYDEGIKQGDDFIEVAQDFGATMDEARKAHDKASREISGMETEKEDREAHETQPDEKDVERELEGVEQAEHEDEQSIAVDQGQSQEGLDSVGVEMLQDYENELIGGEGDRAEDREYSEALREFSVDKEVEKEDREHGLGLDEHQVTEKDIEHQLAGLEQQLAQEHLHESAHEQFNGGAQELHENPATEIDRGDDGWER